MTKTKVTKKKLNLDIENQDRREKKIEDSYKKIKVFKKKLNKVMTKLKIVKKN